MSGSGLAPWALQQNARANARRLAQVVGCSFYDSRALLSCLQEKRVSDIVSAVDDMIRDGNTSAIFGPVVDDFLPSTSRFFDIDPEMALERGLYKKVWIASILNNAISLICKGAISRVHLPNNNLFTYSVVMSIFVSFNLYTFNMSWVDRYNKQ